MSDFYYSYETTTPSREKDRIVRTIKRFNRFYVSIHDLKNVLLQDALKAAKNGDIGLSEYIEGLSESLGKLDE